MKLSSFVCFLFSSYVAKSHGDGIMQKLRVGTDSHRKTLQYTRNVPQSEEDEYFQLVSKDSDAKGCLTVEHFSGAQVGPSLILGTCGVHRQKWKYDCEDGLLYSKLDDSKCMQAGFGGVPKRGRQLRLVACDDSSRLQQFDYDGNRIILRSTNFCVAFRGSKGDVDIDPILLKPCNVSTGMNWSEE